MSSKMDGGSHPILDRFLENPAEVFPPQQKSFVGHFISRVVLSGADAKMHSLETDTQIRALSSEVESYHRESGDKIENLDLKLIAQKINSLDVEEPQKEAIHKLLTEIFMKSMDEGQDIDDFIKKNDKTTCDIFMQVLQFLDEQDQKNIYGKDKKDLIKFSMALLQGGTCNAFILPNPHTQVERANNKFAINNLLSFYLLGSDQKEICEIVKPLLKKITLNDDQSRLLTIIEFLVWVPSQADRMQFLKDVAPLLQQSNLNEWAAVVNAINRIPSSSRKQAIENTAPLAGLVRPYVQASVAEIVGSLGSTNSIQLKIATDLDRIQKMLRLIPPQYVEEVLPSLITEDGDIASTFLWLIENEQSREALYNHLAQALEKVMVSSPESASKLAQTILNHERSLALHDEHPLYQRAINVKVLTDPDNMKDPKNPYNIYNSLLKREPLVDFPVPSVKIEGLGLSCSFDVQGLQSARKTLTFEDLPKIDKKFLEKSFATLEARMQEELTLAETEQDQKRIKEISELIEAIKKVKTKVFNATTLISSLLTIEGKPDAPVPQSLFQLYTVIAYLTTLSTDRKVGHLLSEQEDELMLFAQCIVHCKTGQEDGLAEYYNGVLTKGFSNLQATEGSSLEAVIRFAEISIQPILGKALADEKMFRKVMGFSSQQKVPQLVHQLGYWKNKTYELIGLQHTVAFDENSGWIMDELINKSAPELAEATLKEIPFSIVVDDFLEKANQALQASGKLAIGMAQIYEVLEEQLSQKNLDWSDPGDDNKGPGTRYFTFDKDGSAIGITRLAAVHLLIAAHYGKQTT